MYVIASLVGNQRIDIGCCGTCGLVGYMHRQSNELLQAYYKSEWMGDTLDAAIARAKEMQRLTTPTAYGTDLREPVFEVGCGYGNQVRCLQLAGYQDIEAIESCAVRAEAVRQVHGIRVFDGDFLTADIPRKYSLVVSHHAIEHVTDPDAFVRRCSEITKPGGKLVLSMPNFYTEPSCGVLFFAPHLYSFTVTALTRLLNKHGYAIDCVGDRGLSVMAQLVGTPWTAKPPQYDHVHYAVRKLICGLGLHHEIVVPDTLMWSKHHDVTSLHPSWPMYAIDPPELKRTIAIAPIREFKTIRSPVEVQFDGDVVMFNK
jgi:2-polyprenyl-3-methyl-5-hydroxy-6-metoxy-1,4-benzoquinol methylase